MTATDRAHRELRQRHCVRPLPHSWHYYTELDIDQELVPYRCPGSNSYDPGSPWMVVEGHCGFQTYGDHTIHFHDSDKLCPGGDPPRCEEMEERLVLMNAGRDLLGLSPDTDYIMGQLLPEWVRQFTEKTGEYGGMANDLGTRAQFVDIHRKVMKLKRAEWEGADTSAWSEQPREIAMDMIGHLFLYIMLMDKAGSELK